MVIPYSTKRMNSSTSPRSSPASLSAWLLGGRCRYLLLQALFSHSGDDWTVAGLRDSAQCGQATVYEVLRALVAVGLVTPLDGRYSVNRDHALAAPLEGLVSALRPYASTVVSRPARGVRRT